jgi:hypothetical protein
MSQTSTELRWKNHLAIGMVIYAVLSTIAWYQDSGHSTSAILRQNEVSNHWGHFQAKSVKASINEGTRDNLLLELARTDLTPARAERLRARLGQIEERLVRYEKERKALEEAAADKEAQRDESLRHSSAFGRAMMLLQIAIVLGSVASLMNRVQFHYLAMALGVTGSILFANGWWLFF